MSHVNVGMMTSGGLAPCLSSSIAHLVTYWAAALESGKISGLTIRMYKDGYKGILLGDSFLVEKSDWKEVGCFHDLGGSPIGNSRVKVRSGWNGIEWNRIEWNSMNSFGTLLKLKLK